VTAARLLKLYPRAWRERYGDEFIALVGHAPLSASQVIDIVSGAIDARLSTEVRGSARTKAHAEGGSSVIPTLKQVCVYDRRALFSRRDALLAAAAMILGTLALSGSGFALDRLGLEAYGDAVKSMAFPVALMMTMPFTWMKGQPWKAQAVVLGGSMAILAFATWVATKI
jgi:hypothetical protein